MVVFGDKRVVTAIARRDLDVGREHQRLSFLLILLHKLCLADHSSGFSAQVVKLVIADKFVDDLKGFFCSLGRTVLRIVHFLAQVVDHGHSDVSLIVLAFHYAKEVS